MLFHKSLLRELRSTAGGVFAVLLTTLVTMILIRALGRAASGRVESELVLPLIVFNTISLMNTVLMLTVYISLLVVLSRWWRDSEMVIWLTSGRSLLDLIKPAWSFIWPMMLLVTLLSTVVGPWSRQQITSFEEQIKARSDSERVTPGQFRESLSGQRVFFLENPDDESGRIGTVFVRSNEKSGHQTLLVSATGRFETDDRGQQWVVLERGQRTDIVPGTLESRSMGFETYRVRVDPSAPGLKGEQGVRAQSMMELISRGDAVAKGEISLRVGLPLLTLALGILAIPLAVMSARSGRAANLIVALLIYLIASNLFGAVKAAVSQTRLSFAMAWWPLPLALLLLAGVMIWWRMGQHMGPIEFIRAVVRSIRSPEPRVEG